MSGLKLGLLDLCHVMLLELRDRYTADEIVFVEIAKPLSDRLHSCDLLSSVMGLMRMPETISA